MTQNPERDYVLGTNDEEIQRLGLQHRVWRPTMLACWQRAGITVGSRVLDVGAGPGYATLDLAGIVGPTGQVIAVERSSRFVQAARAACQARGYDHVQLIEADLMSDAMPAQQMDAVWCRWVASFVSSPATLVTRIAAAVRPGGVAVFHEYVDYATWRLAPRRAAVEDFVQHVMESWRASGGEPDIALQLPQMLADSGFTVRSTTPRVFCVSPRDHIWHWPASFISLNLKRLVELGRVDAQWALAVEREVAAAAAAPETLMVTPMVLEIIAERSGIRGA
ncbi:MAG: methyltransferase domain-containing protein [Acidobacteria bacterium]|nr:methyltransferase domain-containing protein [Acidobacteriota bacterium]